MSVEFFERAGKGYNLGEARALIESFGEGMKEPLREPELGRIEALERLVHDVDVLYYNKGFWKQHAHTLHVHGKELFGVGDATGEGVAQGLGIGLGFAFNAAGVQGTEALFSAIGTAIAGAGIGLGAGEAGDAASGGVRGHRATHRAERTLNFREVMQQLDQVLDAAGDSLGSSTWHYRVALRIRAQLHKDHGQEARTTPEVTEYPFSGEPETEARFAYKLCSFLHHEQKVRANLLPILGAIAAVGNRAKVWRHFWERSGGSGHPHALRDYAEIVGAALEGTHLRCGEHRLCYKITPDGAASRSSKGRKFKKKYEKIEDEALAGVYKHPLRDWVDLRLEKEKVRGERTAPSKTEKLKKGVRRLFKRKKGAEHQGLLEEDGDGGEDAQPYDATYHDDDLEEARDGLAPVSDDMSASEGLSEEQPAERFTTRLDTNAFLRLTGRTLVNPYAHTPLAWRALPKPPTGEWMDVANAHKAVARWCPLCREDVGWMLFQTHCEVTGKSLGERTRRKMGRKWKNADKGKWGITLAVTAVGIGVSVATLGAATPVAIGASLAVGAGGQIGSKAYQAGRLQQLVKKNAKRASEGGSSSASSSASAKKELKMDHAMIRQFNAKIRRHFKACEEAWARMMYFVTGGQDLGVGYSNQVTTCFEAAQFVWAARKFMHHYDKLQLYLLPMEHYAYTMLSELDAWRQEWDADWFEAYADLLLRHHSCPHGPHRVVALEASQTMHALDNGAAPIVEHLREDILLEDLPDDWDDLDSEEDSWNDGYRGGGSTAKSPLLAKSGRLENE